VEVLPDLGEEVKEGQEEGVEGVEPAVEAAWGGDVAVERYRGLCARSSPGSVVLTSMEWPVARSQYGVPA
jgi:hypothetical protein